MIFLYEMYKPFVDNLVKESLEAIKKRDLPELDRIDKEMKDIFRMYKEDFTKVYGKEPRL